MEAAKAQNWAVEPEEKKKWKFELIPIYSVRENPRGSLNGILKLK
jgi:hypothetical protein